MNPAFPEQCYYIFISIARAAEAERICDRIAVLKTKLLRVGSPEDLERSISSRRTVVQLESIVDSVLAAVKKLNAVKTLSTNENKLILEMTNPETANPQLVRTIVAAGGNIQYVTEEKSTLEDVYLKLVRETEE